MNNALIGTVLKSLLNEYNNGACDSMSKEDTEELLESLSNFRSKLELKVDKTYTTEESSKYLNVTRLTINNYVKEGKLHPKKQLGGVLLYSKKELDNLKYK